jgi:hypothetical protein
MNSNECFSIKIEGDFIDSFIYSGTLFLVHANSKIVTYNWELLLNDAFNSFDPLESIIISFLKDCRQNLPFSVEADVIFIDNQKLNNYKVCELILNEWSTDINVYSNRLYIANENGVKEFRFDYQSRIIDNSSGFSIYNKYAYKISPNDGHRLAIAAGQNGVIAVYPRSGYIQEKDDITLLLEENTNDCEWIGVNLAANTTSGSYFFKFPKLPEHPKTTPSKDYWDKFNIARKSRPSIEKVSIKNNEKVFGWAAGEKIFILRKDNGLILDIFENDKSSKEIELDLGFIEEKIDFSKFKVLNARTGLFGTAVEFGDILFIITNNGIEAISNRPVSWRLFPRAKNYVNHIHIIENDHIMIRAYIPENDNDQENRFGINLNEIT